jgi:hypothetical protein
MPAPALPAEPADRKVALWALHARGVVPHGGPRASQVVVAGLVLLPPVSPAATVLAEARTHAVTAEVALALHRLAMGGASIASTARQVAGPVAALDSDDWRTWAARLTHVVVADGAGEGEPGVGVDDGTRQQLSRYVPSRRAARDAP